MFDSEPTAVHTPKVLREVLDAIETLRITRQEERKAQPHRQLKRFTQQELNDEACPTYKNLLVGRSLRVPSRQTILHIADYLECTAIERNDLLLAARYLPETLELEGAQLQRALEQACHLMETLPYPAMVVSHTLEVHAVNERFRLLFESPTLAEIPLSYRHLFHFLFHPDLLTRKHATFDAQSRQIWQAQALRGIQLFKQSNVLYQFEPWYRELIERFCTIPDFRTYWEQDVELLEEKDVPSKLYLSRHAMTGVLLPIQLRTVYISAGTHRYPGMVAFFPLDEAAHAAFASLDNILAHDNAVKRR